jgi:8-oxo-dGTP pyrophosphatase MutT (NUDIX family)
MKIPAKIYRNKEGQYCINCFSSTVERVYHDGQTRYHCSSCSVTLDRSLVIDNAIVWWISDDNTYWHESVGLVIIDRDTNDVLCIMRKIFPFAYALPAGHLDQGEKSHVGVKREVQEELGLSINEKDIQKIATFLMPGDSCRRGADDHKWNLYKTVVNKNEIVLSLNDEASSYKWIPIKNILMMEQVTYPLRFIVEHFEKELTIC